jgi:hypothetical protein
MKNVNVSDMKVFSVSEVSDLFGIDVVESGVYKIISEDRGDVVSVESVDVVDGEFKIESKNELILDMVEEFEIFVDGDSNKWKMIGEYREELVEYVYSEMNSEYDGVYSIGLSEDDGIDIVRVEV